MLQLWTQVKTKSLFFAAILLVFLFCVIVSEHTGLLSSYTIAGRATEITADEISLTVLDENTVVLENLIKGDGVQYNWWITHTTEFGAHSNTKTIALSSNESISFYYDILTELSFQAVIEYNGICYTSGLFYVQNDGSIILASEDASSSSTSIATATTNARGIDNIVSLAYLAFLITVAFIYYLTPKKQQYLVLLLASIIFYLLSGVQYILCILCSSLIVFICTKKISQKRQQIQQTLSATIGLRAKKELKARVQQSTKPLLYLALIASLGTMIILKYTAFFTTNINLILPVQIPLLSFVMPLGLSFYTFMLIAYLVDVYRGKYDAETSFLRFFLFVSFFPHVSQGPISRYKEISAQLRAPHSFSYRTMCFSAQRILWGVFLKLVLADRISLFVVFVFGSYSDYSWAILSIAIVAYSIQIYADFYACMEIALGSAQLFGITLPENFLRPYFATNMPEFWRRWHISLGAWFRDYVFYPISISKRLMRWNLWARKKFGANVARVICAAPPILSVWMLTGLWHGASWSFLSWGFFHGILIFAGVAFAQPWEAQLHKIGINTNTWAYKLLQMGKVFFLCCVGRIFFTAATLSSALQIIVQIASLSPGINTFTLGESSLTTNDCIVILFATLLLLCVDIVQEKWGDIRQLIAKTNIVVRWSIWFFLISFTLAFGEYASGAAATFVYEAF